MHKHARKKMLILFSDIGDAELFSYQKNGLVMGIPDLVSEFEDKTRVYLINKKRNKPEVVCHLVIIM